MLFFVKTRSIRNAYRLINVDVVAVVVIYYTSLVFSYNHPSLVPCVLIKLKGKEFQTTLTPVHAG